MKKQLWVHGQVHCLKYNILTFTGKTESLSDKLRSILAQYEYQHCINQLEEQGINFRTYLYVPEIHPITKELFFEREDEAHVLKVT